MTMLGRKNELTSMQSMFLLTLNKKSSLSGSEIVEEIAEDIGEDWVPTPGARYKILQFLLNKKLIKETTEVLRQLEDENKKLRDKRIRKYHLTSEGKTMVKIVNQRMYKLLRFMSSCCPEYCNPEINDSNGVIILKIDPDID